MNLNYHELTMNEPRDSPGRRKQFLVICGVMATCLIYSTLTAGILHSVKIEEGIFAGGEFVYKFSQRDYAASMGMVRRIGENLDLKPKELADVIYSVYLDDPALVTGGRQQRFASGLLAGEGSQKDKLMKTNANVVPLTETEVMEIAASELWARLEYKKQGLPKVKASVVQFPFTDGFISALIFSYKVIPAMRRYNKAHGDINAPIISTCSTKDQMCTHYSPLQNIKPFLLGNPSCEEYAASLPPNKLFDVEKAKASLTRMFPFIKSFSGFDDKKDEL